MVLARVKLLYFTDSSTLLGEHQRDYRDLVRQLIVMVMKNLMNRKSLYAIKAIIQKINSYKYYINSKHSLFIELNWFNYFSTNQNFL